MKWMPLSILNYTCSLTQIFSQQSLFEYVQPQKDKARKMEARGRVRLFITARCSVPNNDKVMCRWLARCAGKRI